ncbi:MAG: glycosyltransferase family 4 protein [Chloroflexi bacterium]|nr:glycosyltransferase family 4 protein [Chloroflexota bacterium]
MKIALVSPYDIAHPGGVPSHILALERHLTRMGHEVKVIAPASKPVKEFGDRFIRIGTPRPIPSSDSIVRISISFNLASKIKEVLGREKFDIVHLHEPFMPMLCSATLRFSNLTNVGTFHAADGKPGYRFGWPIGAWLLRRRLHKLSGRIAVSKPALKYHSKYIPGPFEIIPNGVDTERFNPGVAPIEKFCDGKKNILFLGRLEYRKGLKFLLRAFQRVKREIPDSRLIVVGPGTRLRKGYEKWVRRNQLEDDIIFIGFISEEDKPRYFKTADIYCAPSTGRESQGIVLLEAMAVGTPIVASNIDGYASVVTHGQEGLLVPPKNSAELAKALTFLLKDESLRQQMSVKGKVTAEQYSWERVARRVVDFYGKTLAGSCRGDN